MEPFDLNAELMILGSGTSEGVPRLSCLTGGVTCEVCHAARFTPDTIHRRRNTSAIIAFNTKKTKGEIRRRIRSPNEDEKVLYQKPANPPTDNANGDSTSTNTTTSTNTSTNNIDVPLPDDDELVDYRVHILIDCGKTFMDAALTWLVKYHIRVLDAVIITHEHADATFGLDDLRDYTRVLRGSLPIYVRSKDLEPIRQRFPYLVNTARATGSQFVAQLDFRTYDTEPIEIEGLTITPFTMEHGPNCDCSGYKFGSVLYMSDCVGLSAESRALIGLPASLPGPATDTASQPGPAVELAVLDSLLPQGKHVSHWCWPQARDFIHELRPKQAVLIGMSHSWTQEIIDSVEKDDLGPEVSVRVGHDGQRIPLTSLVVRHPWESSNKNSDAPSV
jgi:phosphoribosyl 1,2-cyclic phosphodiesterase